MAGTPTNPNDIGYDVVLLGKITGIDMTTAAVFPWFKAGANTCLATAFVLKNFSSFNDGGATPATWAFSIGTDSSTAPVNMRAAAAATATSTVVPIVGALALGTTTLSQYVLPGVTCYFAVTTTTNGVGTFDAYLYGAILPRNN